MNSSYRMPLGCPIITMLHRQVVKQMSIPLWLTSGKILQIKCGQIVETIEIKLYFSEFLYSNLYFVFLWTCTLLV
jgi:hypothetical protein